MIFHLYQWKSGSEADSWFIGPGRILGLLFQLAQELDETRNIAEDLVYIHEMIGATDRNSYFMIKLITVLQQK